MERKPAVVIPAGPRWNASPSEVKFICCLLHAERVDLPLRLRHLFEGTEVLDSSEAFRVEICGETLVSGLSDHSKELVRDLLHVQHALGGRCVLWIREGEDSEEVSQNLRILMALAKSDEAALERLGALGLLSLSHSSGGNVVVVKGRKVTAERNAFAPPLFSALRLALSDAEVSARQGNLKAGIEHLLSTMERDHMQMRWRAETRKLAELVGEDELARRSSEEALKRIEAALSLIEEREERKKMQDESSGVR